MYCVELQSWCLNYCRNSRHMKFTPPPKAPSSIFVSLLLYLHNDDSIQNCSSPIQSLFPVPFFRTALQRKYKCARDADKPDGLRHLAPINTHPIYVCTYTYLCIYIYRCVCMHAHYRPTFFLQPVSFLLLVYIDSRRPRRRRRRYCCRAYFSVKPFQFVFIFIGLIRIKAWLFWSNSNACVGILNKSEPPRPVFSAVDPNCLIREDNNLNPIIMSTFHLSHLNSSLQSHSQQNSRTKPLLLYPFFSS